MRFTTLKRFIREEDDLKDEHNIDADGKLKGDEKKTPPEAAKPTDKAGDTPPDETDPHTGSSSWPSVVKSKDPDKVVNSFFDHPGSKRVRKDVEEILNSYDNPADDQDYKDCTVSLLYIMKTLMRKTWISQQVGEQSDLETWFKTNYNKMFVKIKARIK